MPGHRILGFVLLITSAHLWWLIICFQDHSLTDLTDKFTILEPRNLEIVVSEVHKTHQSTVFEAVKLGICRSGNQEKRKKDANTVTAILMTSQLVNSLAGWSPANAAAFVTQQSDRQNDRSWNRAHFSTVLAFPLVATWNFKTKIVEYL